MRLRWFRVQNYKSVIDSGQCWTADDVTVLAGKNESGKTALLEAVREFDADWSADGKPLEGGDPRIDGGFQVERWQLLDAWGKAGPAFPPLSDAEIEWIAPGGIVQFSRRFGEAVQLSAEAIDAVRQLAAGARDQCFLDLDKDLGIAATFVGGYGLADNSEVPLSSDDSLAEIRSTVEAWRGAMTDDIDQQWLPPGESFRSHLEKVLSKVTVLDKPLDSIVDDFDTALWKLTPQFVFFSDFDDLLPDSTPISASQPPQVVVDFAHAAGIHV